MATTTMDKSMDIFCPPANRTMQLLDRSFFKKKVSICAAKVQDRRQISRLRSELQKDLLSLARISIVQELPGTEGSIGKGLLLKPEIQIQGETNQIYAM